MPEINLSEWRFEIEPALAAPSDDAGQIRFFEAGGNNKAVDFQDKNGNVGSDFEEIKGKIRKQMETLVEISE